MRLNALSSGVNKAEIIALWLLGYILNNAITPLFFTCVMIQQNRTCLANRNLAKDSSSPPVVATVILVIEKVHIVAAFKGCHVKHVKGSFQVYPRVSWNQPNRSLSLQPFTAKTKMCKGWILMPRFMFHL